MEGDVFPGSMAGRAGKLKREKPEGSESDEVHLTLEADDIDDDGQSISLTLDANGQYQFRASSEQGAVTYRVVQVRQGDDGHLLSPIIAGISPNQQAMIQGLVTEDDENEEMSTVDETRLAYLPATLASGSGHDGVQEATTLNSNAGQFYVMMAPQDVLQSGQHGLVPRSGIVTRIDGAYGGAGIGGNTRGSRDDKRRATHNEVERRRRDKINTWISHLGTLIPDCAEPSKQSDSKGGVLSKACDYIKDLQSVNKQLTENMQEMESVKETCAILRQQCEEIKQENEVLRAHLSQHGIELTDLAGSLGL